MLPLYPSNQQDSMTAKIDTYDTEIENGILNMVISLCMQKADRIGDLDRAKDQVSNWLERIISGLRENNNTSLFGDNK